MEQKKFQLLAVVIIKKAILKTKMSSNLDVSEPWVTNDVSLNNNLFVGGDLSLNEIQLLRQLGVFQTTNTMT